MAGLRNGILTELMHCMRSHNTCRLPGSSSGIFIRTRQQQPCVVVYDMNQLCVTTSPESAHTIGGVYMRVL